MKVLGYLIAACIALAGVRLVAAILVLAVGLATIIAFVTRPRETIGLAVLIGAAGALNSHPVAFVALTGLLITACVLLKAIERSES